MDINYWSVELSLLAGFFNIILHSTVASSVFSYRFYEKCFKI